MRNLEQYPITTDEIVQCLKALMDEMAYEKTGLVGDMRPLLLANAIQLILASAPALDDAVRFIGVLGEELVSAGMPAGDRSVILANVRELIRRPLER